jgi:hypothetical protein
VVVRRLEAGDAAAWKPARWERISEVKCIIMRMAGKRAPSKTVIALLIGALYVLHQDFWWWTDYRPLLFGFLPVGLAYHAGYCMLAALLMGWLVRWAWPAHLEKLEPPDAPPRKDPRP